MAATTGHTDEWLGYYLGVIGGGSLVLAFLAYRGTHVPAAKAQAALGAVPRRRIDVPW